MKRSMRVFLCLIAMGYGVSVQAQMGMDLFKKPSIKKAFHPVVGRGAQYEAKTSSGKDQTIEIGIVAREAVEGKDGYWMQFVSASEKGQSTVGKTLFTIDDFQFHRMIVQPPGQSAMEMPFNPSAARREKTEESLSEWHSIGSETVTVPAGTFSCEHWKNDKTGAEAWTSDKVTPFGLVKQKGKDDSMVLVKILDSVPDRITGPVKKFDMQEMMQQMQKGKQQP